MPVEAVDLVPVHIKSNSCLRSSVVFKGRTHATHRPSNSLETFPVSNILLQMLYYFSLCCFFYVVFYIIVTKLHNDVSR